MKKAQESEKEINKRLNDLLKRYDRHESLQDTIFLYCETQEERQRMIEYIEKRNPTRGKVCEYAAVIAIEAGTAEGKLEECDDDYWD